MAIYRLGGLCLDAKILCGRSTRSGQVLLGSVKVKCRSCIRPNIWITIVINRGAHQPIEVDYQVMHYGDGTGHFLRMAVEGYIQRQKELGVNLVEHHRFNVCLRPWGILVHLGIGCHGPHSVRVKRNLFTGKVIGGVAADLKTKRKFMFDKMFHEVKEVVLHLTAFSSLVIYIYFAFDFPLLPTFKPKTSPRTAKQNQPNDAETVTYMSYMSSCANVYANYAN